MVHLAFSASSISLIVYRKINDNISNLNSFYHQYLLINQPTYDNLFQLVPTLIITGLINGESSHTANNGITGNFKLLSTGQMHNYFVWNCINVDNFNHPFLKVGSTFNCNSRYHEVME